MSTQPVILFPLVAGRQFFKSLDQGWLEVMGGRGISTVRLNISKNNQLFQLKIINSFLTIIISSIILLLFFILIN